MPLTKEWFEKMEQVAEKPEAVELDGKAPRLERWCVCRWNDQRIRGNIYDDPRFPDGVRVTTSIVKQMGPGWLQTKHTFYVLGSRLED